MVMSVNKDDLFFVCTMIEYVFYPVTDVTFYSFLIFVYLHIEIYA